MTTWASFGHCDLEPANIDMRCVAGVCRDRKLAEIDRKLAEVLRVAGGRELSQRRVRMAGVPASEPAARVRQQ